MVYDEIGRKVGDSVKAAAVGGIVGANVGERVGPSVEVGCGEIIGPCEDEVGERVGFNVSRGVGAGDGLGVVGLGVSTGSTDAAIDVVVCIM